MLARCVTVGRGTRGAGEGARAGELEGAGARGRGRRVFIRPGSLGSALGPFDEREGEESRAEPGPAPSGRVRGWHTHTREGGRGNKTAVDRG